MTDRLRDGFAGGVGDRLADDDQFIPGLRERCDAGLLEEVGPVRPRVRDLRVRDRPPLPPDLAEGLVDGVHLAQALHEDIDFVSDIDGSRRIQMRPAVLHLDDVRAIAGRYRGNGPRLELVAADGLDVNREAVRIAELLRLPLE